MECRYDYSGVEIRKGSKKHRIIFADKLKKPLVQIYMVESFKKYNNMESTDKNQHDHCCIIF